MRRNYLHFLYRGSPKHLAVSCFSNPCIFWRKNLYNSHICNLVEEKKISKALLPQLVRIPLRRELCMLCKRKEWLSNCIKRYWEKPLWMEMSQQYHRMTATGRKSEEIRVCKGEKHESNRRFQILLRTSHNREGKGWIIRPVNNYLLKPWIR